MWRIWTGYNFPWLLVGNPKWEYHNCNSPVINKWEALRKDRLKDSKWSREFKTINEFLTNKQVKKPKTMSFFLD